MAQCQVLIIVVALFNWLTVHSQSPGKALMVLKEDSSGRFNDLLLTEGTIGHIRNSDAIFELRYYKTPTRDRSYTTLLPLKYYDGYTEIKSLQLRSRQGIYLVMESDSFIIAKNYGLTELFSSPLCNLPDQKKLIDSIRVHRSIYNYTDSSRKLQCMDCDDSFFLLEIKSRNSFRNFYLSDRADGYSRMNSELGILKPYADLLALIRKIFLPVKSAG
jgi:hypothetical protein